MLYNAKSAAVPVDGIAMEYVVCGNGQTPLVVLPGLGEAVQTVGGQALPLALYHRPYLQRFKVYIFSRKRRLREGVSTLDMARDQKAALDRLGIRRFQLLGISQGGMIAQHMAILYPEAVQKLALGVSVCRPNQVLRPVAAHWMRLAKAGDFKELMVDTLEHTYTQKTLKRYRLTYPFLGLGGKRVDFGRFLIQAQACLGHDTYRDLGKISCPTLVLGGSEDQIVGGEAAAELAGRIPHSELVVYQGYGHGAYEECKGFHPRVIRFLQHGF